MKAYFRTQLAIEKSPCLIELSDQLLSVGSCFAQEIGEQLTSYKLKVLSNPFGTLFNPLSIHRLLRDSLSKQLPPASSYVQNQEVYYNELFHSTLSALSQSELEKKIQHRLTSVHDWIQPTDWLLLTWGTAWIYTRKETGKVVANCHRLPAANFEKSLLMPETIVTDFAALWKELRAIQPTMKAIITVSPVRHMNDGLSMNNLSKSILRVACHQIQAQFEEVFYFPSYEIIQDDLRDYRFYKKDLVHPNEIALDYVWDKFSTTYFNDTLLSFIKEWTKIKSALEHQAFHPDSASHQKFLKATLEKLKHLPYALDFSKEEAFLRQQLSPSPPSFQ